MYFTLEAYYSVLVTFLDEAYAPGVLFGETYCYYRTKNQVRRRKLFLKNVTNI